MRLLRRTCFFGPECFSKTCKSDLSRSSSILLGGSRIGSNFLTSANDIQIYRDELRSTNANVDLTLLIKHDGYEILWLRLCRTTYKTRPI